MSKCLCFPALIFLFLGLMAGHGAPPDAAMGDASTPLSAWELVRAGGWVLIPLAVASILAVTLIVFYFFTFRESAITTPEMVTRMQPFLENEDMQGLAVYVADKPQAVARVVDQILKFIYRHPDADGDAIQAVAQAEGTRIATQLNQRAVYLMDLGVLAPMLGLFGTVIGILRSFGSIAAKASPMRTMLLAGGVSQALISTAIGLIVGITAMAFYSYFRGSVQHLISLLESQCTVLVQELLLLRKRRSA
jgi:biopolymer transport protein ExbB